MSKISDIIVHNTLIKKIFLSIYFLIIKIYAFLGKLKFYALTNSNKKVICHFSVEIKYPENLITGNNVVIGPECILGMKSKLYLGNNVVLSKGVILETAGLDFTKEIPYKHISKEIYIDCDVWIGNRAIILGGVRIGKGSIIGAGAIITKDVPENTIVVSGKNRYLNRSIKDV